MQRTEPARASSSRTRGEKADALVEQRQRQQAQFDQLPAETGGEEQRLSRAARANVQAGRRDAVAPMPAAAARGRGRGRHSRGPGATSRNLFRDQSYSVEELAKSCIEGEIRFPDWQKVLEPLRSEGEVYRRFHSDRVPSELLSHVRLAARSRRNSTHVTALVRAESGRFFRHYDNDSPFRQRGTFESISMRAAWGANVLFAILAEDSPLCKAIDALHPIKEGKVEVD